ADGLPRTPQVWERSDEIPRAPEALCPRNAQPIRLGATMSAHSRTSHHSIRMHRSSTDGPRNLVWGTMAALLMLGLAGCGRSSDASHEEVVTSAAVTGTAPVIAASAGTAAFSAGGS